MFNLDIILIDLSLKSDFEKIIENNELSGHISPESLISFKKDGYLRVWVDRKSIEIVAYTTTKKSGLVINNNFFKYLNDMTPIKEDVEKVDVDKTQFIDVDDYLSVDMILDKISDKGIKSLTKDELEFLERNS